MFKRKNLALVNTTETIAEINPTTTIEPMTQIMLTTVKMMVVGAILVAILGFVAKAIIDSLEHGYY